MSDSIDLSVPLSEIWWRQQPHAPTLPVVADGMVFYGDAERHTTAISEERRVMLWQSVEKLGPEAWWGGLLLGYAHGGDKRSVQFIEPRSGRVVRETAVPGGCVACAANERWIAGVGIGDRENVWCLDPERANVLWSNDLDEGALVVGAAPSLVGDTVVVTLDNGEVLAWHAANGTRRWASSVADLSWRRMSGQVEPGKARGWSSTRGDRIFFNVFDHYVAALDVGDGSRVWAWGGPPFVVRDGQVFEDKYYVFGWPGEYRILDARNGRELVAIDLKRHLPREFGIRLAGPLLVTASHILVGSEQGSITAFVRDSGRFAWTFRPRATGSTEVGHYRFVVGNDRVYYADYSFRIRCLGRKPKRAARPPATRGRRARPSRARA